MLVNENSLKARSARSSIFLIRTGIAKLKEYQDRIEEMESLERLVIEADQLSSNLKRLESLITDAPAPKQAPVEEDILDVHAIGFFAQMAAQGKLCSVCGQVKIKGTTD
ncbi:MAG: hypothetical protein ABJP79_00715 [Tateyamaria sp.]|uniref:hypothetical protein n=1 Tax=Tateyamaria sp. TaxID=1929288 RepID=UPI00329C3DE5